MFRRATTAGWRLASTGARRGFRHVWPNRTSVAPVLFTIGYERHRAPESLVKLLRDAGVERLVDVRQLPMSRRKGFSKTALAHALQRGGVTYEHERALGNPKAYRDLYRTGERGTGERLYRAHLKNGSSDAVDKLAETLTHRTTCVLCYEHDHKDCHRAVIVDEVRGRLPALKVTHL